MQRCLLVSGNHLKASFGHPFPDQVRMPSFLRSKQGPQTPCPCFDRKKEGIRTLPQTTGTIGMQTTGQSESGVAVSVSLQVMSLFFKLQHITLPWPTTFQSHGARPTETPRTLPSCRIAPDEEHSPMPSFLTLICLKMLGEQPYLFIGELQWSLLFEGHDPTTVMLVAHPKLA